MAGGVVAKGGIVSALKRMHPAGIAATAAIGAVTAAVILNRRQAERLRREYAEPLLFDNGGVRLSDLNNALAENNFLITENARAIAESYGNMQRNRQEMRLAAYDLEFYSHNLRENGVLAPSEAEAMSEPFNRLADSLGQDFAHKFDIVHRGLRNAAGLAGDLGVNIGELSGILEQLRDDHLSDLETARDDVNEMLSGIAAGDDIDFTALRDAIGHLELMEELLGGRRADIVSLQLQTNRIDFGDWKSAERGIGDIHDFLLENQRLLSDAAAIITSSQGMRSITNERRRTGAMTPEEAARTVAAIDLAEIISLSQLQNDFDSLNKEVETLANRAILQLGIAERAVFNGMSGFSSAVSHLRSIVGSWGNDFDIDDTRRRQVLGELYGVIEDADRLLRDTRMEPIIINPEVDMARLFGRTRHGCECNPNHAHAFNFHSDRDSIERTRRGFSPRRSRIERVFR
jgi:hypothetical protein